MHWYSLIPGKQETIWHQIFEFHYSLFLLFKITSNFIVCKFTAINNIYEFMMNTYMKRILCMYDNYNMFKVQHFGIRNTAKMRNAMYLMVDLMKPWHNGQIQNTSTNQNTRRNRWWFNNDEYSYILYHISIVWPLFVKPITQKCARNNAFLIVCVNGERVHETITINNQIIIIRYEKLNVKEEWETLIEELRSVNL